MALTITPYNHTLKKFLNKEVALDALKVMLLDGSTAFSAAHTTLAQVTDTGADQVSGNGWAAGGELIGSVAVTVVSTNGTKLDGADITKTATGGSIGPAEAAVIYDDTDADDAPLFYIDFDGTQEAGVGTDFKVVFHADGIKTIAWA